MYSLTKIDYPCPPKGHSLTPHTHMKRKYILIKKCHLLLQEKLDNIPLFIPGWTYDLSSLWVITQIMDKVMKVLKSLQCEAVYNYLYDLWTQKPDYFGFIFSRLNIDIPFESTITNTAYMDHPSQLCKCSHSSICQGYTFWLLEGPALYWFLDCLPLVWYQQFSPPSDIYNSLTFTYY